MEVMVMEIRVGLEFVDHRELGFDQYSVFEVGPDQYVHVLVRRNEPMVVLTRSATLGWGDLALAETLWLDYPTKPALKSLKLLKKQWNRFLERVAEAIINPSDDPANDPLVAAWNYLVDLLGLMIFSLRRRGAVIEDSPLVIANELVHGSSKTRTKTLKEINEWLKAAEEPAPSLGNRLYIDIAKEALELALDAARFLRLALRNTAKDP